MYTVFVATLLDTMKQGSTLCSPRCTKESETKVKAQVAEAL